MKKLKVKNSKTTKRSALAVTKSNGRTHAARQVVPLRERRLSFGNKWDYAPAPETFEYIKIPPRHELFINGEFVPPHSGKYFESLNPATEDKLSEIAAGNALDVDNAVRAARHPPPVHRIPPSPTVARAVSTTVERTSLTAAPAAKGPPRLAAARAKDVSEGFRCPSSVPNSSRWTKEPAVRYRTASPAPHRSPKGCP
jgi:hypothetical protein